MPIIIDGWNFIRNERSDLDDSDGDAVESARTLMAYLQDFQHTHDDPIVVVFDSSREHLDLGHQNDPKLTVIPAKNADAYIKKYIDKVPERQRRNVRVVSSDKEVFYYAKSSYATAVRCEEFWGKLKGR